MKTPKTSRAGFTLLEVMIATGILAISGTLVLSLSYNIQYFEVEEQAQNTIEQDITLIKDYLVRDIQSAGAVSADFSGTLSYPSLIILKVPEFNANGTVVAGSFDYIVYEDAVASTGRLHRTVYDDKEGSAIKSNIGIDVEVGIIECYVDDVPWYNVTGEQIANTVKTYISIYDSRRWNYKRDFYISTTLRNHMK